MLDDLLNTPQPPAAPDRRGVAVFTQEWNATGDESTITATSATQLKDEQLHEFITQRGGIIPDGHTAIMVSAKYNPNAWTRDEPYDDTGRKTPAVTRGSWSYTFRVVPTTQRPQGIINELIQLTKGKAPKRVEQKTSEVFVFALGDSQLGKPDGKDGGTAGVITAWTQSLTTARTEWIRAGKPMVLIAGLGDHLEGNQSQNGRNFYRSDITVSEQLRLFRRMLLRTIDTFIEAPSMVVGIVNGNHDDIQRFQTTDASDGHATESAIAVSEAMQLNPERYGHVKLYVPGKDEDHLVLDVNGTNFVLIHGHQWGRGKAMEWWEKQTFNNQPAAAADILIHGHEHEFQISSRRDRLIICTPALESESTWFKQKQGAIGRRGALMFITKPKGQFDRMAII
jgi:predicted phosphodiesterase